MASDSGHTGEADGTGTDNVIRFPRDWFGSKDDLIPFGPSADRIRAEREAAAAAARDGSITSTGIVGPVRSDADLELGASGAPGLPVASGPPVASDESLSADDFWGEGAAPLHQAVDLRSDAVDDAAPPSSDAAALRRSDAAALRRSDAAALRLIDTIRLGRRPRTSVAIAVALVVLACGAFVVSHAGGSRRLQQATAAKLTASRRAPAVADQRPSKLMSAEAQERDVGLGVGSAARAAEVHSTRERLQRRPAADRHRGSEHARARTAHHRAAKTEAVSTGGGAGSGAATGGSPGVEAGTSAAGSESAASGNDSAASGSDSAASGNDSAASGNDSAASGSNAAASGSNAAVNVGTSSGAPDGFGGALGSYCNPVCRGS